MGQVVDTCVPLIEKCDLYPKVGFIQNKSLLPSVQASIPLLEHSPIARWQDYMFEAVAVEEEEDFYQYVEHDDVDDDMDEAYFGALSSLRIGNRRWGDNGFVRAGCKEARPVINRADPEAAGSSSGPSRKKEAVVKDGGGRRSKRVLKHEVTDKAAAAKHEHHLQRSGVK